jgi:NAD(P)-dependent dehydrogenase (short-subunit alcohol dehydrogenase family)
MQIEGMAAIVTGGASGLGAATADRLAKKGAKVTIFDLDSKAGAAKAKEIGGHFISVNITDDADVTAAIAEAEGMHGKARILVNCAGIAPPLKTVGREGQPHSLSDFTRVVTVNLIGSFNVLSKFAARLWQAERIGEEGGVIINTASVAAFDGQIGQAAYAASKGGVVGMTLPIARDLMSEGIRVNTILPGIFNTPLMNGAPPQVKEALAASVPFPKRLGNPEEYAMVALTMIECGYFNGEDVRIDGAIRMAPR